jgi:hypothetical protein
MSAVRLAAIITMNSTEFAFPATGEFGGVFQGASGSDTGAGWDFAPAGGTGAGWDYTGTGSGAGWD